ncbi:cytochrome b N-terminal domain-containing protein [Galbitalea sp. SE-J8]|uniref:cytochrome bc1 complex cytochrome b subunit n=1 Tax=Galbitalea sp. SE-J8 TaxID=3054952 RepID=UPI00259CBB7E|nr:cytochrome b N-terminal domain-containing protein [Galbitalea sp. SE-J8]MDM4763175.1 cytochrome b N-terminal domain-containing protein [Galbitalea sp. SE-J8]
MEGARLAGSAGRRTRVTDRVARWLDERTRIGAVVRAWRDRVFPDHWSVLLGQVVVASFVVCALTGVFLLFFYDSSTTPVQYDGPYAPLREVEMSRALESTLDLSFEIRGGLLMRQLHHWSASLMIAALLLHILRVFFTGASRTSRELNWLLLFGILFASMAAGLTGQVLPDDMLSGSSLAVLDGILETIPVMGTWLSFLVFQGEFPAGAITTFYPLHIVVMPAIIVVLMVMNGILAAVHKPPQFPGPGRTESNVVGRPFRAAAVNSIGLFLIVFGVLTAIAATVTVNPIWNYGPADPGNASAGGGALWYLAFLDGAQRLVPPGWEFVWLDRTWTLAILVPVGVCALFLVTAMIYPFIEGWITGDRREHHLLTRPRDAPTRTGIGVAGIVFYGVLWAAAGSDLIALHFSLSTDGIVLTLQLALLLGPAAGLILTKRICLGLQRKDREIVLHGHKTGRIVRLPDGEYVEVHEPVNAYERWRLIDHDSYEPLVLRPDEAGRIRLRDRARATLSRWFFQDRILPITASELRTASNPRQPRHRDDARTRAPHLAP